MIPAIALILLSMNLLKFSSWQILVNNTTIQIPSDYPYIYVLDVNVNYPSKSEPRVQIFNLHSPSISQEIMKERLTGILALPLDVLLRVLSLLDTDDLTRVSQTCIMLKVLAREAAVLRNFLLGSNSTNFWTRRLATETFAHFDSRRDIVMNLSNCRNFSLISTLNCLQQIYGLGLHPRKAVCRQSSNFDDIESNAYHELIGDIRNIAGTHMRIEKKIYQNPVGQESSPDSRHSSDSIFSEHHISDNEWNVSLAEMELSKDPIPSSTSTASTDEDSISKLRYSNKVKDKAALFERLLSRESIPVTFKKKYKYRNSPYRNVQNNNNSKNISRDYLEEIEKSNNSTPITTSLSPSNTPLKPIVSALQSKYDHFKQDLLDNDRARNQKNDGIRLASKYRSKLKVSVRSDNTVFYERIEDFR